MAYVQSYNSCWRTGHTWAEIVDYEVAFQRQERKVYYEEVEAAVERRLKKMEAEKPKPSCRLLAWAAALIW